MDMARTAIFPACMSTVCAPVFARLPAACRASMDGAECAAFRTLPISLLFTVRVHDDIDPAADVMTFM